jgi:hypothetical protein
MNIFVTYYDIDPIDNFTKIVCALKRILIIDLNHYKNINF